MKNLNEILYKNSEFADKIIFSETTSYTYSELISISESLCFYLCSQGLQPGEPVGILGFNSPEFVAASFGIWRANGTVIPLNYSFKPEELFKIIKKTELKFIFIDDVFLQNEAFRNVIAASGLKVISMRGNSYQAGINFNEISAAVDKEISALDYNENNPALLIFTSGTTSEPKGVVLTHKNMIANIISMSNVLIFKDDDLILNILPLFHVFSFNCATLLELYSRARVFMLERFSPKQTLETIFSRKITILLAVPAMLKLLIICKTKENTDTSSLRLAISGGAALDSCTFDAFKKEFGIYTHEGFGLTETSPVCTLNLLDRPPLKNSIGLPLKNVKLRIINESGDECKTGERGELLVYGDNVMPGYFRDLVSTKEAFTSDGWYKTGDIAECDAQGYYYIVDRLKDMIIVNGLNVYPADIENIILTHGAIIETSVIGAEDKKHGEKIVAFVVPKNIETFDKNRVLTYVKSKLAHYKVPDRLIIVEQLPKSAIGKVLKKELKVLYKKMEE